MAKKPRRAPGDVTFVTQFTHHITGKVMRAEDYGLVAFPIRRNKKPKKA